MKNGAMRRAGLVLALVLVAMSVATVAFAQESFGFVFGDAGVRVPNTDPNLANEAVPAHLIGKSCEVTLAVTNNESKWPGNNLTLRTGNGWIGLDGVEDDPGHLDSRSGILVLGATIEVTLRLRS